VNAALTVAAAEPARTSGQVDAVLASLPVSLVPAPANPTDPAADLVAIDGEADWTDQVARAGSSGARGAVVVSPGPGSVHSPIPVVLDREFAGRPGVDTVRPTVQDAGPAALLEIRSTIAPDTAPVDVVLEQLALVRTVLGNALTTARVVRNSSHGHVVRGRSADGREVLLTAERTTATDPVVTVRVVGAGSSVSVTIPRSRTARPVEAVVTDASGARLLPTHWESSHRAAWRRLRDAVLGGTTPTDLSDHAADAALLTNSLPELLS
jgi:hypothetical protein